MISPGGWFRHDVHVRELRKLGHRVSWHSKKGLTREAMFNVDHEKMVECRWRGGEKGSILGQQRG